MIVAEVVLVPILLIKLQLPAIQQTQFHQTHLSGVLLALRDHRGDCDEISHHKRHVVSVARPEVVLDELLIAGSAVDCEYRIPVVSNNLCRYVKVQTHKGDYLKLVFGLDVSSDFPFVVD